MSLTRRQILGGGLLAGAAYLSAHAWGHRPLAALDSPFLGSAPRRTLLACFDALLPEDADAVAFTSGVDAYLATHDQVLGAGLRLALNVLEHTAGAGPMRFTRFSRLPRAERLAVLEGWMRSRVGPKRQIATAIRKTVMFTYYSDPSTWARIGYDGPWVKR